MFTGSPDFLHEYFGLPFVFGNVLLEQLGLPIPAVPAMVVGGAAAMQGEYSPLAVFAVALVACVIGDGLWYLLGRLHGARVLRLLCSISLSPDSCVRQTSTHFERWGAWTLVLAKFLPGIGAVVPPLAGVMRMTWPRFFLASGAGSVLWAGLAVGAGMLFHAQVGSLLARLEDLGARAVLAVGALLAAYIAFKWWERQRFYKTIRMARISVEELRRLMDQEREPRHEPFIVDLRGPLERAQDRRSIPGARAISLAEVGVRAHEFPHDRDIVFYCNCPNEASAASAAKALMDLGYKRVRPLLGGLDAWGIAGYEYQAVEDAAPPAESS